jgi:S-adenosylmethionine hydrolase
MKVKFVKTFSDVAIGDALAYIDSRGRFAMAVNQGNFAVTHSVKPPMELSIARAR